ncbi:MAG TPA: hypothetical protein VK809_10695 [Bacteroidia bacterium]|jgi:hypothetical protein|nr:hypothetical protein [Bacteroidia bacterium]
MKRIALTILITLLAFSMQAQDSIALKRNAAPEHKWYGMTGAQLIFSKGEVMDNQSNIPNILRFTCFFHVQHQFHYDFGRAFGLYTGFSIINVGFINSIGLPDGSSATLKQRSYSFGIPLALKFGNMPHGDYLAIGAEGECMFAYKQKILYNGNKTIFNDNLFSSNYVNLFNPSVFGEVRFHSGTYIRFKYYLLNFLQNKTSILDIGSNQVVYTPEKSTLYYVSVGLLLKKKHKHHLTRNDV